MITISASTIKINSASLLFFAIVICATLATAFAQTVDGKKYKVVEETDVKVSMRDGVRLSTNIFRPDSVGKFPVLLLRTPYGKNEKGRQGEYFYAERGYVVVIQDVRGRYGSEGVFDAYQAEAQDGFDTQEWIGRQSWCNGSIGTFGSSYEGFTQWLPAGPATYQQEYDRNCFKHFELLFKIQGHYSC